jgi:hypothetical protein
MTTISWCHYGRREIRLGDEIAALWARCVAGREAYSMVAVCAPWVRHGHSTVTPASGAQLRGLRPPRDVRGARLRRQMGRAAGEERHGQHDQYRQQDCRCDGVREQAMFAPDRRTGMARVSGHGVSVLAARLAVGHVRAASGESGGKHVASLRQTPIQRLLDTLANVIG